VLSLCNGLVVLCDLDDPEHCAETNTLGEIPAVRSLPCEVHLVAICAQRDLSEDLAALDPLAKFLREMKRCVAVATICAPNDDAHFQMVLRGALTLASAPLRPLYDIPTQELTPRAEDALVRVFNFFDSRKDGALPAFACRGFDESCLAEHLPEHDRLLLYSHIRGGDEPLSKIPSSLSRLEFLEIFRMLCMYNRSDVVWFTLHTFGFDADFQCTGDAAWRLETNLEEAMAKRAGELRRVSVARTLKVALVVVLAILPLSVALWIQQH
jgi:hypothetical protein